MDKKKRQGILKELILSQSIERQEDMMQLLQKKGVDVTQATISRDMKELGVVKIHEPSGLTRYGLALPISSPEVKEMAPLEELFSDLVLEMTRVQFMNVIKTTLGTANVVAAELDRLNLDGIVGTMAGMDTIILISSSDLEALKIYETLSQYIK